MQTEAIEETMSEGTSRRRWRIAGINFAHLHMGDNLRVAFEHPDCEIVGSADESVELMQPSIEKFSIVEIKTVSECFLFYDSIHR